MNNNKIFVISGPSGVGKGTLVKQLFARVSNLHYSVSGTTRKARRGEVEGKNYFFLRKKEFLKKVENGEFLEWVKVYKDYYGTFLSEVDKGLATGRDVVLELDPQGAIQVKKRLPDSTLIFIIPPSLDELENRLKKRSSESPADLNLRLKEAKKEMKSVVNYDYKVVNDKIESAVKELERIIEKERRS